MYLTKYNKKNYYNIAFRKNLNFFFNCGADHATNVRETSERSNILWTRSLHLFFENFSTIVSIISLFLIFKKKHNPYYVSILFFFNDLQWFWWINMATVSPLHLRCGVKKTTLKYFFICEIWVTPLPLFFRNTLL